MPTTRQYSWKLGDFQIKYSLHFYDVFSAKIIIIKHSMIKWTKMSTFV